MARIDLRKKTQYFKNRFGLNDVHVFRDIPKKGFHSVGINGTSYHYVCENKIEVESKVLILINKQN